MLQVRVKNIYIHKNKIPIHPPVLKSRYLAVVLAVTLESSRLISTSSVSKTLGNSYNLEVVLSCPVDQPGSQSVDSAGISLVHERDVTITTSASLLELLLALLSRLPVPVTRVDVVGNDLVAELLHGRKDVATSGEVRRAHVGGLLADDVDHGLLELLHLLLQLIGAQTAEVLGVGPCVTGDLVARVVGLLDGGLVVVDTAVQLAGPEECTLRTGLVEDVDQLVSVLARTVIVGEGENTGLGALANDLSSSLAVEDLNGIFNGSGSDIADEQEAAESGDEERLHFRVNMYKNIGRHKEPIIHCGMSLQSWY
jgi:hypothetical protein